MANTYNFTGSVGQESEHSSDRVSASDLLRPNQGSHLDTGVTQDLLVTPVMQGKYYNSQPERCLIGCVCVPQN